MSLRTLSLQGFRSYRAAAFEFSPGVNLIIGLNGAGKTNLLEAVYLLSAARSWRGPDRDLITHGDAAYNVQGQANRRQLNVVYNQAEGKKLLLNRKPVRPEKFVGQLPAVLFEPNSINIVAGPPEERRRFLNRLLSAINPRYLRALIDYKRVLKQRNALLRSRIAVSQQIFAWDIKMVELANVLFEQRQQLLKALQSGIDNAYAEIAGRQPSLRLEYSTALNAGSYPEALLAQLSSQLERDIALGFTSVGPHRDDMLISFNEQLVTQVASRGEQRTLTLALKLLELELLSQKAQNSPVILLDDVFSELDEHRRGLLLERLDDQQTLITATDIRGIVRSLPKTHAKIELGKANARRRQNLFAKKSSTARSRPRPGTQRHPSGTGRKVSHQSPRPQPKRRRA